MMLNVFAMCLSKTRRELKAVTTLSMLGFLLTLSACAMTEKFSEKFAKVSVDSEFNTITVKADAAMHDGEWAKAAALYERVAQMKPD